MKWRKIVREFEINGHYLTILYGNGFEHWKFYESPSYWSAGVGWITLSVRPLARFNKKLA